MKYRPDQTRKTIADLLNDGIADTLVSVRRNPAAGRMPTPCRAGTDTKVS